ncbi:MAG TPA: TonB-dependent receptor, partial [Sphingomicrobium sp.]|nr:TonB-dependent receptor [Sphingomicrobium sp.]
CAGAITDPNLIAVCRAQGAPAASIGKIPLPTSGQAQQSSGGNPYLLPETAKTWTVGAVIRPRFFNNLSATVDYYNIKITNAISAPTALDVINACFANITASSATNPACTGIRRNPSTGALSGSPADTPGLPRQLSNLGKLATDGVDFTLDYRHGLGTWVGSQAKLAIALGGNWTHKNTFQATPSSVNRDCNGYYSVNCNPQPRWSFNERTTLSLGRLDLSVLWRYLGSEQFEPLQMASDIASATSRNAAAQAAGKALPCPDFQGTDPKGCLVDPAFRHIKAYNYFDFATRFNVNEHFELTFTITNLFDRQPPVVGNTIGTTAYDSGNTYPSTYDPLGRRFTAGARIKF